jgi:uncharacterized protein (DUF2235 family)
MNSDAGLVNTDSDAPLPSDPMLQQPSNVTRIARCVAKEDSNGIHQISFYQSGIGSYDILDRYVGGVTGLGLSEHIRDAYQFIAANYDGDAGDEIFLVGFSRGSFTARSVAAFIDDIGLITPTGMQYYYPIFEDWENQQMPQYQTHFKNYPFPGPRPNLNDPNGREEYVKKLHDLGFTVPGVKIKAIGCYDTVGSLGIPRIGLFSPGKGPHHSIDYAFVDTSVPKAVEHAIHALALDERREPFAPTMWELPDPQPGQTLTQVWFQGGHADVGGSYNDTRASDITLAWMVQQLSSYGLEFNMQLLKDQYWSELRAADKSTEKRDWACGMIHDAMTWWYRIGGLAYRTPMEYLRYDHATGEPYTNPDQPLVCTEEMMHASVRIRMGLPGLGFLDKGTYESRPMEGWNVKGCAALEDDDSRVRLESINRGQENIYWEKEGKKLPEAPLGPLEYELLRTFLPSCEGKFLTIAPKPR